MSDSSSQSVIATLRLIRDITALRRGPEDLPASWGWLLAMIAAPPVISVFIGSILPEVPPLAVVDKHAAGLLVIDTIVTLLWGWGLLQIAGRSARFLQMMTAVFGCQLLLQLVIAPTDWAMRYFPKDSSWFLLAQAANIVLSVWAIVVIARILRAATDWPIFFCVALVVAQGLVFISAAVAIFPDMPELLKQAQ